MTEKNDPLGQHRRTVAGTVVNNLLRLVRPGNKNTALFQRNKGAVIQTNFIIALAALYNGQKGKNFVVFYTFTFHSTLASAAKGDLQLARKGMAVHGTVPSQQENFV